VYMILEFAEAYETMVSLHGSRFPWVISKRAAQRSNLRYMLSRMLLVQAAVSP
jgi:hypothetical protein